jgi:hypothetical protein
MDMGDEFDLGKDETLKILEFLIDQNWVLYADFV